MRSRITAAVTVIAVLALALAAAPPAIGDGDPASDVLLGQNVFYPYNPPVPNTIQRQLNALTASAAAAGFPIKVALIDGPTDLGVVPSLFDKPQKYADFLDQEISFQKTQLLLVVMPSGYGVRGLPAAATAAAAKLAKPSDRTSTALAQAALAAIPKLADAAGHSVRADGSAGGNATSGGGADTGRTILLIALILAVIATAGALLAVRRRRGLAEGP